MNTVPLAVLLDALDAMDRAMHDDAISAKAFNRLNDAHAPLRVMVDEIVERQQVEINHV